MLLTGVPLKKRSVLSTYMMADLSIDIVNIAVNMCAWIEKDAIIESNNILIATHMGPAAPFHCPSTYSGHSCIPL